MKVAVIGMGHMGVRHAANLLSLGHKVLPYDPAKGLNDYPANCDAAVVATPPQFRPSFEVPTFYEKPLALTAAGAREICVVGAVGYNWRFDKGVDRLREETLRNRDGRTLSARFEFGYGLDKWWPGTAAEDTPYAKTGVLLEASHELDLVRWFFGDVNVVGGWIGNRRWNIPREDTAMALLDAGGIPIEVHLDMTRPHYWRNISIVSEQGVNSIHLMPEQADETYRAEIAAFMRWVETGARDDRLASIEDGYAALEIADAIRLLGNQATSENEGEWFGRGGWQVA